MEQGHFDVFSKQHSEDNCQLEIQISKDLLYSFICQVLVSKIIRSVSPCSQESNIYNIFILFFVCYWCQKTLFIHSFIHLETICTGTNSWSDWPCSQLSNERGRGGNGANLPYLNVNIISTQIIGYVQIYVSTGYLCNQKSHIRALGP